jgi:hypothetical protein
MDQHDWIVIGVTAAALAGLSYILHGELPLQNAQKQPDKQVTGTPIRTYDDWFPKQHGEHFAPPVGETNVVLPVRYPARAGHEITSVMEGGMGVIFKPRSDLYNWMNCPPENEE